MWRQDDGSGRHALSDDTDVHHDGHVCQVDLEKHLVLNSDRHDTYPKIKSAVGDHVEHVCHKSDPIEVDEMTYPADEDYEGEWAAVGYAKSKSKGRGNLKNKEGKVVVMAGAGLLAIQNPRKRGEKGPKAAHCGKDRKRTQQER